MISRELVVAVLRRPRLWGEAVRTLLAVASRRWWRRPPFLPIPDPDYAAWRVATAHGDASIPLEATELVHFLEWRKKQHGSSRRV